MAIQQGDTVSLHYTGRLETGETFDSSEGREPLQFKVGAQQVIPGFENGVVGLEVGDKKTIEVPPTEGYGERDERMVQQIERARIDVEDLQEGQVLGLQADNGQNYQATVVGMDEESVTLDFNHFLAGKTLVFEVEVVAVA